MPVAATTDAMSHEPKRVIVFDTTLRDGEQAPGFSMDVPAKLVLARALDGLGVDIIEAGFPIASPADFEGVRQVSLEVRRPVIAALARCREQDIDEAARALEPAERGRIHTFLATSDLHLERKLRITHAQCLESIVDGVRRARRFTDDVEFSAEDATRSDHDFLCRVVEAAIENGATTINLPDTVGYGTPEDTREFFEEILRACPIPIAPSSARTATTIWAWRSPTASRRSRAACGRSSAPSTASASAPATPRSRKS